VEVSLSLSLSCPRKWKGEGGGGIFGENIFEVLFHASFSMMRAASSERERERGVLYGRCVVIYPPLVTYPHQGLATSVKLWFLLVPSSE